MVDNLLLTKLYNPPPGPRSVDRPQLISRMNEGLARGCKLTMLSAPVGYGKTTLVSQWLASLDKPIAWLSLDPEDDDPLRFWIYVIRALQTVQPDLCQMAITVLQTAQQPPVESILIDLINQIAALSEKIILVLDDIHLIESTSIHQGLNFLLDHLPPQLHLVFITREDPPIPLPQMRAKGQISELRIMDLRFNQEEIAEFFNQKMRANLPPEGITALGQRTEGWAAGLQMAALSLYELDEPEAFIEDFAGDNRYVADYLISEVLDRQPEHIRQFLLHTSIVDRFTPSLCDALRGDTSQPSSRIIDNIEAQGLFLISLDHVRQWYRYHQLFSDLLRYRLRQEDITRFISLNRMASRWFQQRGHIEESVKYALVAEDYEFVADLIEKSGLAMFGRNRFAALQDWISALPETVLQKHPYLSILLVWTGSLTGQSELARRQLALAEENLLSAPADLRAEIASHIALLWAYAERTSGDLDASIKHARDALNHLPKKNVFLDCTIHLNLGGDYWLNGDFPAVEQPLKHAIAFIEIPEVEYPALAAAGFLANTYLQQGRLNKAEALCKKIGKLISRHAHPAAAYVFLEQGELLLERNDLDGAADALSKTIQIGEYADKVVNVIRARQLLAQVHLTLGDLEKARELMLQADELYKQTSPRYQVMHQIEYEYYRLRCQLSQPDMQAALQWADDYSRRRDRNSSPWALLNELAYAHLLLADEQPEQALSILTPCEESARSYGAGGWVIQNLVLQSLCYYATNNLERAMEILHSALTMAEPEIYIRTFISHGPPMQKLLRQAAKIGIFPEYVATLLTAISSDALDIRTAPAQKAVAQDALVEPLTDQERSILRLMAAGLSHAEIARELYISINTVKWHTTHIYSKLGVHRRAHAVSRAQELGIL